MARLIAKTVTFRVIVTTLDFTTNYIVIGELATAAGLSTFNLIAGPVFYFAHEAAWSYLRPPEAGVTVRFMPAPKSKSNVFTGELTLSPALAKTITFRTFATVMDFATNYVVVGNAAEALILSAAGFVLGPFVYFGHEKAWEYFDKRPAAKFAPADDIRLLPASSHSMGAP